MTRPSAVNRKRGAHTYWYNDEPIVDIHEALDMLWLDQGSSSERYIAIGVEIVDLSMPELHADWYTEGDSGGDMSGWYYFRIDPELVKKLREEELLEPRKVLYMGGFYLEHDKLVLSDRGKQRREQLQEEKRAKAIKLMRPGVYEKIPPLFDEKRVYPRREHGTYGGELYFTFHMISGDVVHISPDTGKIEVIPAKKTAEATGA